MIRHRNVLLDEERYGFEHLDDVRPLVFLTGDPGSGKSVRASDLSALFGVPIFSTGDYLRTSGHAETIRDGAFGPDGVVWDGLLDFLTRNMGGIIDGFPRRPHQVGEVFRLQGTFRFSVSFVEWLHIDADLALSRYSARSYHRSALSNTYGPYGGTCPLGGTFDVDDVADHYLDRRAKQAEDLRTTLAILIRSGIPLVQKRVIKRDP